MKNILRMVLEPVKRALRFIHHELWEVELEDMPTGNRLLVRLLRTGHLVIRGVRENYIPLHASALTLGTLVSIVPIMAITFSMYKGLGAKEEDIRRIVMERMVEMPAEFQNFILQMLDLYTNTNFAALGGIFLIVLLFIVIRMLGGIEGAFNRVWYISTNRNILRKISNYISVLVVVPILVMAAGAASASVDTYFREQWASLAGISRGLLRTGPLAAVWLAFSFLYIFLPNTRVKIGPGLISGFIGALCWLVWQSIYIDFQVGVSRYNAIYGTFASVPIFLGWLYVSWIILLLGAEIAFAIQNSATYQLEIAASGASPRSKLLLAIGIVRRAAQAQQTAADRFEVAAYAKENRVSIRLVNEMVELLEDANILAAWAERPGCYVLLRTPENLPLKEIVDRVLLDGSTPEDLGLNHLDVNVQGVLTDMDAGMFAHLKERTVKDLLSDEAGTPEQGKG